MQSGFTKEELKDMKKWDRVVNKEKNKKRYQQLKNRPDFPEIQERKRKDAKEWYMNNRERASENHKEYYEDNKEKLRAYHKEYYQKNVERFREYNRRYRMKQKERENANDGICEA